MRKPNRTLEVSVMKTISVILPNGVPMTWPVEPGKLKLAAANRKDPPREESYRKCI